LAAGIGSRYGGLKQAEALGPDGETFIDYAVYDAIRAGFGKAVFVIRRDIETAFKESIAGRFDDKIETAYAYQELDCYTGDFTVPADRKKPWGTAHAVMVAADMINEPFASVNGDDFYGAVSFALLGKYLSTARDTNAGDYSMVAFELRNTLSEFGGVNRGICKYDEQYNLKKVVETYDIKKDGSRAKFSDDTGKVHPLSGDELISMNMWGFTPSIFDHLREGFASFLQEHGHDPKAEYLLPTLVNTLVATGTANVKMLPSKDAWFGVTYPEDKPYVVRNIRKLVAQGDYPEPLWG